MALPKALQMLENVTNGDATFTGTKTFSTPIEGSITGNAATATLATSATTASACTGNAATATTATKLGTSDLGGSSGDIWITYVN